MTPLQALWIMLPVILGGLVHVAVIKLDLWPALAAIPLDAGLRFRGRRLFGANKTLRGLIVMPAATLLFAVMLAQIAQRHAIPWAPDASTEHAELWGLSLGLGYVIGELPNSFVKRQLEVAPGAAAGGWLEPVFWVVDQIDGLAGAVLLLCLLWIPPPATIALLVVLTLVIHPAVAAVMVLLGLKQRIG
jgi:CDP-archaeol synthase